MDKLSILNRIFFLKLNEIYIDDIYDKNILLMIDKKIEFEKFKKIKVFDHFSMNIN